MKKISTVYLLSAIVLLGSCAREYPTFNQMPTNAYQGQKAKSTEQSTPEIATAEVMAAEQPTTEAAKIEALSTNPEVVKMLAGNSPKQIDEQLESALATTQGQALMAKPLVAAQINKARKLIARNELNNSPLSGVQTSQVSKLVNKTLRTHVEKNTLAPVSTKAAKELNQKIKIGLILIGAGIIISLLIPFYIGGIVGLVGVVFVVLGLLEM